MNKKTIDENIPDKSTGKRADKGAVPELRFPEFCGTGAWEEKRLGDVATFHKGKGVSKSDISESGKIECIRYGELYTVYAEEIYEVKSKTNEDKKSLFLSNKNDILIPSSGETAIDIARASCINKDNVALGGDINVVRMQGDGNFFSYYFSSAKKNDIAKLAQGSSVVHLYSEKLKLLKVYIPPTLAEQEKIAGCLSSLDALITAEERKIKALKKHKKGLMQQLFPAEGECEPLLRFPEFRGTGAWEEKRLGDVLDYQRPDKYIVTDTNYLKSGTPVLTANKSFILGFTNESEGIYHDVPVIIFDDFTVDKKYVDFDFKVKSSAIKILITKGENNLKFIYETMNQIKFEATEHKRYYISVYQNLIVFVPTLAEQEKIAGCFSSLDALITAQERKIKTLKRHKKGLMQKLFPSE